MQTGKPTHTPTYIIKRFQQCERTAGCTKFILVNNIDCLIFFGNHLKNEDRISLTEALGIRNIVNVE